jgi:hypothetical protein
MAAAVVGAATYRRQPTQCTVRYKSMSLKLKNTIIITLNSTILVTMCGLCAR